MKYRKHVRLKDYDYSADGYYFITICCSGRAKLCLTYENIIQEHLNNMDNNKGVKLDYYKTMPEHIHMIIILEDAEKPLYRYIQDFKAKTTLNAKKNGYRGKRFWQPNYYEHIIRSEKILDKIRRYIENNPDIEKLDWKLLEK